MKSPASPASLLAIPIMAGLITSPSFAQQDTSKAPVSKTQPTIPTSPPMRLTTDPGPAADAKAPKTASPKEAAPNGASFDDLVKKAEAANEVKNFEGAAKLYNGARALPKISAEQKARAQFGFAASLHEDAKANNRPLNLVIAIQKEYEAALQIPQLPGNLRIQAHEAVGDLLLLQGQRIPAIREYQKIVALPSAKSETLQAYYLKRIAAELQKAAVSPDAVILADATLKQLLPLQKTPEAVAAVRNQFAGLYIKQKQMPRAMALWNDMANDKKLPLPVRADALRKTSAAQRSLKKWPEALATADRLIALPDTTPQLASIFAAWRGWDRAGVFLAQGDEATARTEWEAMIASPQIGAGEKGRAWMELGASYGRTAGATPTDATLLAQKTAYENAAKLEGAAPGTRAQAILNRGQLELDAKNTAVAIEILTNGLKDAEGWKLKPEALADVKRELNFAMSKIYRGEKDFNKAIATLVEAQKHNIKKDPKIAKAAVAVSQEAFAAKQWDAARNVLGVLRDVWAMNRKTYLLNMVQVEVADEKWVEARTMLDEIATLKPTPAEASTLEQLKAKIPAA